MTSDVTDFNLTEITSNYPQQYHISSTGDGSIDYRWLDVTPKTTVISANSCGNLALLGSHQFNAGVTDYRDLFTGGGDGLCFVLRGRTAAGSGSMSNYDGRVQR